MHNTRRRDMATTHYHPCNANACAPNLDPGPDFTVFLYHHNITDTTKLNDEHDCCRDNCPIHEHNDGCSPNDYNIAATCHVDHRNDNPDNHDDCPILSPPK